MRVLITGGTGFIGSRLSIAAKEIGWDCVVLGQSNTEAERQNFQELEQHGIRIIEADVTDREAVFRAIADIEIVFHLAAAQHEANVDDDHFNRVNVRGTQNVLDACVAAGVKRFVHGSTIGVYGNLNGEMDETAACRPENIYGVTKYEGERLVLSYGDKIEVAVIRIPETYGPGDRRLLKLFRAIQKKVFFTIGGGKNYHQLIFIEDLIKGLFLAATHKNAVGQVILVAGKESLTTQQMVVCIAESLSVSPPMLKLPLWPVSVAAIILETVCRPLGIQPPLHKRRLDFFKKSYRFRHHRAEQLLGFEPAYGFLQGAVKTAEWYASRGLIAAIGGHQCVDAGYESDMPSREYVLKSVIEPFDTFWEAPENIEKGYQSFGKFYQCNYLKHIPIEQNQRVLVISCGTGYFVNLLKQKGCVDVLGIDSDPRKVAYAQKKNLNCQFAYAFDFLLHNDQPFDLIFAEQELNHLTKEEIPVFLDLCMQNLNSGARLVVHSLNGANPITGSEALAQNFNHHNTFTEYSLSQILAHAGFTHVTVFPLHLYIFYKNPANYIGMLLDAILNTIFRLLFVFYGKSNKIFSKKIGATAIKPED